MVGVESRTALHWAAFQGKHKFVKVLLSFDASVSARDVDGRLELCIMIPYLKSSFSELFYFISSDFI
jgi:ankyrin repeat protein